MTRKVIYGEEERLVAWAEERMEGASFRDDAVTIGAEQDGQLRAVTVFDTFTTTSCLMHLVSDGTRKWMTREFLTACFAYPFITCNYPRVTGLVYADNKDALRLDTHLGFVLEGRLREDGPNGTDTLILGMLRRECRWLPQGFRRLS